MTSLRPLLPNPAIRLRVNPSLLPTEIELRNSGTTLQWRYVGDADWIDLIDVEDFTPTIDVGAVVDLPAGSMPTVNNVGTALNAIFDFGIPVPGEGTVTIVTAAGSVTVNDSDGHIIINKAAPSATTLLLPKVTNRHGLALHIVDFAGNAGDVTLTPDGLETVMGLTSAVLGSSGPGVGSAAVITIYPNVTLNGWYQ